MGLAEKRAAKTFQETTFVNKKKAIDDAAGFGVTLEVDWESLAVADYAHMYEDAFSKVYFEPVARAFQEICKDDMGKEALKGALKKVVFCNKSDAHGANAISFADGVLKIDHHPVYNIDDIDVRKTAIVQVLEKAL